MTSTGTPLFLTLGAAVSEGATLLIAIAFVVVAVMVRRTRPDAFGLLLSASLVFLGNRVVGFALQLLVPIFTIRSGPSSLDSYAQGMFLVSVLSSLISLVGFGLLFAGVLRLARPPGDASSRTAFAEGRYQGL